MYHDALFLIAGAFLGGGIMYLAAVSHEVEEERRRQMRGWQEDRQRRTSSLGHEVRKLYDGEADL